MSDSVTPWTVAPQASLSITNSQSLFKLISIELVMPSNHLILWRAFHLWTLIFPSTRVFFQMSQLFASGGQSTGASASTSILPMNSGLISFRMDWLDLLAVQGTLKKLLQHYSSKASIIRCSTFFIAQLSHPYVTTRKTIALTRQNFVGKVMPLLFNMLSSSVITFLPRSKCLWFSWLQSPSAVILKPLKRKSNTDCPSICHNVMGSYAMMLVFRMLRFKPTFSLASFNFINGSLVLPFLS